MLEQRLLKISEVAQILSLGRTRTVSFK